MLIRNILPAILCLCLSSTLLHAQTGHTDYEAKWKTVDSLIMKKRLFASARRQLDVIYTLAKKEGNEVQAIKALVYTTGLTEETDEDAAPENIAVLQKEIAAAQEPFRSILESILASTYLAYYDSQNPYNFFDRTPTSSAFKKEDIRIWGPDDFAQKIGEAFQASISEKNILLRTDLARFDPLILKWGDRALRPTLYDLLAHKALKYYSQFDLSTSVRPYEISDTMAFAPAEHFVRHVFARDTLSGYWHALHLYQELIEAHLADNKRAALLDVDMERLNYMHTHGVMEDLQQRYRHALRDLFERYPGESGAAQAKYLLASQLVNTINLYPGVDDEDMDPDPGVNAAAGKALCDQVLAEKDSSEGQCNCRNLLLDLLDRSLRVKLERVNLPGQPFRALLTWRNCTKAWFRVVRIDPVLWRQIPNYSDTSTWSLLSAIGGVHSFAHVLPATTDYRIHRAEIRIDALPPGRYALLSCSDSLFADSNAVRSLQFFHVSSIAYISNNQDYFVVDRESGHPIAGAGIRVWHNDNEERNAGDLKPVESSVTDEHGHVRIKTPGLLRIAIDVPGDTLHIGDEKDYSTLQNDRGDDVDTASMQKETVTAYLFTDRAIYRPGQLVYFKGIVTRSGKTQRPAALPGFKTKVILHDANSNRIDSLYMITNSFGSYHGQFRIPEGLLNGDFSIDDDSTGRSEHFSVEEYKRPGFFLTFDKLKGNYRLNDSIRVTGRVISYAGNRVDGAKISYQVKRDPVRSIYSSGKTGGRYISWRQIGEGETRTAADGSFTISFVAEPDREIDKAWNPVFLFDISADATDPAGETHSANTSFNVAYTATRISFTLPHNNALPNDSLKRLLVRVVNMSDEEQPAEVHTTIFKLHTPDRLIRERIWPRPDRFTMTKEEFLKVFPHDEYDNETDERNWGKEEKVFDATGNGNSPFIIGHILPAGWYLVLSETNDSHGQAVKDSLYVHLYDAMTGDPGLPMYNWRGADPAPAKPGDRVVVRRGSSAAGLFVIRYTDRIQNEPSASQENAYTFFNMGEGAYSTVLPVTEGDKGGFGINDVFVKDNRLYRQITEVRVPWSDKELTIHYASYRDKTLPGSKEKWSMTISGTQADQKSAEVMTVLYDSSLDQFEAQSWPIPDIWDIHQKRLLWETNSYFGASLSNDYSARPAWRRVLTCGTDYQELLQNIRFIRNDDASIRAILPVYDIDQLVGRPMTMSVPDLKNDPDGSKGLMRDYTKIAFTRSPDKEEAVRPIAIQVRKNLQETAFFLPDLHTDSAGSLSFSFTMPEALTTWRWMTLAHTKDLAFGYTEGSVVTQKPLMVQPNAPRFMREGDRMELTTRIVNLTDSEMTCQAELQLTDPTNGETADGLFTNRQANQFFTVPAKQSVVVSWPIEIPYQYSRPLTYRITASAREFSDGEEATLPVVSNRMLVTESLPLNMPGKISTRHFAFDKLLESGESETLTQHALTVEYTSNPAWYAVQALPYLVDYPYECAEQTFNRFYANALATHIAGSSPRIREVFEKWKIADTAALLSNLQKNQELKSVLLEETPWVFEAKSETQQKKNLALLFDMVRMNRGLQSTLDKLKDMQSDDGGFSWFKGGPEDRYITQYILTGFGRLMKLKSLSPELVQKIKPIIDAAMQYADNRIKQDYAALKKQLKRGPVAPYPDNEEAQYLYMRSYFAGRGLPGDVFPAVNEYRKRMQQSWVKGDREIQGMIALTLYRTGDVRTAQEILASVKETSIRNEQQGMYWKNMSGGYYWYDAPIETQSLLIEAFREISPDAGIDRELKTWLLKQKQTQSWPTTKATADACYALLLGGADRLTEKQVTIRLGDKTISSLAGGNGVEAGTGYFKKVFDGPFVQPSMGNITVHQWDSTGGPSWGAVYWQYFENLDRIVPPAGHETPLKLVKKLFVEKNTDSGPVLDPLETNGTLKPGDKVVVRIELYCDRTMEYVHMKDMRAACMEPVNVLSGYKWQGGLGYYESTKDVSTDFFFDRIPRGTYVFEYPLFVSQNGRFSNGVTTIECMYAPEFAWHSEGIMVNVEPPAP